MSIFSYPRTIYGPGQTSFNPLFRLLDDFESYSRETQGGSGDDGRGGHHQLQSARTFSPRFDVRETETAYELHGELPGIERDQVEIEFTDPQTLVVRGRVERSYTSGTPPAGTLEAGDGISEKTNTETSGQPANVDASRSRKTDITARKEPNRDNTTGDNTQQLSADFSVEDAPVAKFWIAERSVGQFSRTFSLPTRVDQDAVTASLNNGILSVVVPKARKQEGRRIAIN